MIKEAAMAVTRHNGRVVTLRGQRNPVGPKLRVCPKCDAKPGHSCQRWINHAPRYGGGGYWKLMTTFHKEREKK